MPMLELISVSKFFGGLTAVHDASFKLEPRTILSVIGPNGAGKTTLINLITGFYPVSKGEIIFQGRKLGGLKPHQIARLGIARTFQGIETPGNLTVLENVLIGCDIRNSAGMIRTGLSFPSTKKTERQNREEAFYFLSLIGLHDKSSYLAGNLPLGDQRMLAVACALAIEPKVLILDEPAAGLGKDEILQLTGIIRKQCERGLAILLVDHHMGFVMNISERVIVLAFGEKIAEGPPDTIKEDKRVISVYLGEEG
jgi:branched-chain amino acid transport system ATP-binding protein